MDVSATRAAGRALGKGLKRISLQSLFGSQRNRAAGGKASRGQRNSAECLWVQGILQHREPLHWRGQHSPFGNPLSFLHPCTVPALGSLWDLQFFEIIELPQPQGVQSSWFLPCAPPEELRCFTKGCWMTLPLAGEYSVFRNVDNIDPPPAEELDPSSCAILPCQTSTAPTDWALPPHGHREQEKNSSLQSQAGLCEPWV